MAVVPSAKAPAEARTGTAASYAYVGTYTPNGGGIYLFRVDRASGALTQIQIVDDIRNPSWLALNPEQTRLYAISEIDNYEFRRGYGGGFPRGSQRHVERRVGRAPERGRAPPRTRRR